MEPTAKLIALFVVVCLGIFLVQGNLCKKTPMTQPTIQNSNTKQADLFIDDIDEIINNIYYIQLSAK